MIVVKVGGSLYDLPDLGARLHRFLATLEADCLLVPGGGAAADVVRVLDRTHSLGADAAHWLALRACTLNAHFLTLLLPGARVVDHPHAGRGVCVLDPFAFVRLDDALPRTWDATSDSVAARAAAVAGAPLVLLKSADMPPGIGWDEAAAAGLVDSVFPRIVRRHALNVRVVNLQQG